jgi:Leucine-rich repeat (LRR) protein
LAQLATVRQLVELDLSTTQITDAGLAHLKTLPSLARLHLYNCPKITDAGLTHLQELPGLVRLSLQFSKITDEGVVAFQTAAPHVRLTR